MIYGQHFRHGCSIATEDDNLIMTGGLDKRMDMRGGGNENRVALYNRQGFMKELSSLNTGRFYHACSHYRNNNGETVSNNCV